MNFLVDSPQVHARSRKIRKKKLKISLRWPREFYIQRIALEISQLENGLWLSSKLHDLMNFMTMSVFFFLIFKKAEWLSKISWSLNIECLFIIQAYNFNYSVCEAHKILKNVYHRLYKCYLLFYNLQNMCTGRK